MNRANKTKLSGYTSYFAATLFLALILMISSGTSMANVDQGNKDGKVYPGTSCHYGHLTKADNIQYEPDGFVYNVSESYTSIVNCPIINDKAFNSFNGIRAVRIRFRKATSDCFTCELHSRRSDGSFEDVQIEQDCTFAGDKWMSFENLSGDGLGAYNLTCMLSPSTRDVKTGIFNYFVNEN